MSKIKNTVVVISISLKHNDLCGKLVNSNYFYTKESIPCKNFSVRVTPFACTVVNVNAICEGLSLELFCQNSSIRDVRVGSK